MQSKKLVQTFIVGMMLTQSVAQAQVNGVGVLVAPGRGTGSTFVAGPGKYEQVAQDTSAIAMKAMDQAGITRDMDRQFLTELVKHTQSKIADLIKLQAQMNQLSAQSMGSGVSFENSYYPLLQRIRSLDTQIQAEIQSTKAISPESLPSYEPIKVGDLAISAPATTKINLGPAVDQLDNVRQGVLAAINQIKMARVITAAGQQVRFVGNDTMNPDLSNLQLLSADQIAKMELQIRALNMIGPGTRTLDQQYVNTIVPMISSFVRNYGTTERFRFRDENDAKARAQALDQITDAFYRRSYLRKKFGISLGAIQPDPMKGYPKSIANLEKFGLAPLNQALSAFSTQPAIMDSEIMSAFESARNFVQLFDTKLTPVFKSNAKIVKIKTVRGETKQVSMDSDYLAKDTGFIARANSAVTFLTGNQPTAEVMLAVMRLVLADIKEEMLLLQNDRSTLANYHDLRYRSTPDLKDLANLRICQFDWTLSDAAFQAGCTPLKGKTIGGVVMADANGNVQMQNGQPKRIGGIVINTLPKPTRMNGAPAGTISATTAALLGQIVNVEFKNRQQADNLQQQIDMAREGALTDDQRQQKLNDELDNFK